MKPNYQTFIIEMIKHGDKLRAYRKAYPKAKEHSAVKCAERLLRDPEIAAEINEAIAAIHADAYAKACRVHAGLKEVKILSVMKKREILNQIATCELKVGRYVKGEHGYVMVYEDPRPRDIIRAIEVDIRLEEMLNNVRNIEDVKLSRFDIYIDGRPCDDPTAPIHPDIPKGLVMLPRKKKNFPESTGNNLAERFNEATKKDFNPGVKKEQKQEEETPLLFLGGDIGEASSTPEPIGEVDSRGSHALEIFPGSTGNKMEQNEPETLAHPLSHLGEPQALTCKAEFLQNKKQLREKDPLSDSFYKDLVRRREKGPQPNQNFFNDGYTITDEEINALNDVAKEASNNNSPLQGSRRGQPSTWGKMYFPARKVEQPGGPGKSPQP